MLFFWYVRERILGGVFVNAHSVDYGLVSGRISGCGVRTVGDEGVVAGSGDDCIMVEFFHSQKVIVLAVCHAFGKDAGDFSGLQRHAVADEKDDVLCAFHSLFIHNLVLGCGGGNDAIVISAGSDSDVTSLREADLIDAVGNDTVIKGLLDSVLAEELVSRYAIDIDFDILRILSSGNLYVEIKTGASPEFSGVDRKDPDIRSIGYHSGSENCSASHKRHDSSLQEILFHFILLSKIGIIAFTTVKGSCKSSDKLLYKLSKLSIKNERIL